MRRLDPAGTHDVPDSISHAALDLATLLAALLFAGGALGGGQGNERRALKAGIMTALVSGALIISAVADDAYARLLRVHVRQGVVSGISLNLVDYRAVRAGAAYGEALAALASARTATLADDAERQAFWINAYNLLAIKAVLDRYPTKSIKDGGSLFAPVWKRKIGTVGGSPYSLDEIEHGILRRAFREPRVHFAILCASLSCPDPSNGTVRGWPTPQPDRRADSHVPRQPEGPACRA